MYSKYRNVQENEYVLIQEYGGTLQDENSTRNQTLNIQMGSSWFRFVNELQKYKDEFGHSLVPQS